LEIPENLSLLYVSSLLSPEVFERLSEVSDSSRAVLFAGELSGNLKILDTINFSDSSQNPIIDPYINSGGKESEFTTAVFFDRGEVSEPDIKSIKTEDGSTKDEEWLVIYEGEVSLSSGDTGILTVATAEEGETADDQRYRYTLTDDTAQFTESGIVPQFSTSDTGESIENDAFDAVVIEHLSSDPLIVEEINSATELTVSSEEDLSELIDGSQSYIIRAYQSYLVFGTISGNQNSRAQGNASFATDGSEVTFTIRESVLSPTTTGDYFAFETYQGTDFISLGNLPHAAFEYSFDDDDFIYFVCSGSHTLKSFNLKTMREARTIR
jgi:hypothetical protein